MVKPTELSVLYKGFPRIKLIALNKNETASSTVFRCLSSLANSSAAEATLAQEVEEEISKA